MLLLHTFLRRSAAMLTHLITQAVELLLDDQELFARVEPLIMRHDLAMLSHETFLLNFLVFEADLSPHR
jgi:hypothetical protein